MFQYQNRAPFPECISDIVTDTVSRVGDLTLVSQNFPSGYRGKVMGAIKGALFEMLREVDAERAENPAAQPPAPEQP